MKTSDGFDDARIGLPLWIWCLLCLVFWQIFLLAQNPSLMSDDSGEMIAASYRLGISHPPGYPLFCLLGRLFSFVPVGTIAFRFNLLSSGFVLFSMVFVGLSCLALGGTGKKELSSRLVTAACFLSLFFLFFCRSVFAQALTAKGCVYTSTLLFLSVFLWFRVKDLGKGMADSGVFLILFLWSLGLANHWESEALWIPFLIHWFYQEKVRWNIKRLCQAVSLILLGLSLYLYLPLRSALGALPAWGNPRSLQGFLWVVTREPYRGMEPVLRNGSFYLSFLKEYFRILSVDWLPGFILLAFAGLLFLRREARGLFFSTLIFYLPVVLAVLAVPREETKFLMAVYLASTEGLLVFWGFCGISFLLRTFSKFHSKLPLLAIVFLFTAGSFWAYRIFRLEDKSRYYLASDFSINALKILPSKSIFLTEGDNYVVPMIYQRFVLGLRPDIVFVPSIFLFYDWGWNQLAEQDAQVAAAIRSPDTLSRRIEALTRVKGHGGLFSTLDQVYLGSASMYGHWTPWALDRVWVTTEADPKWVSKNVLKLAGTERLRGLETDSDPDDITTFEIHHYYANQFFSTGSWLRDKGDWMNSLRCFESGFVFYPKAAYAYAYMAAILGSEGYLGLAKRLCLLGIEADPSYFGSYENLANVYRIQGELLKADECYQSGLSHAVDRDLTEIHIRDIEKMHDSQNQRAVQDKSSSGYLALAAQFQKEGMAFLGGLAEQIGQSKY